MSELKHCPFCGGEAELIHDDETTYGYPTPHWGVHCVVGDCIGADIEPRYTVMEEAVESWNRRVPPNGWIKMEDRKPVGDCIAYEATRLGVCLWAHGEWEASSWNITHWHPLPEPPKEVDAG